MLGKQIPFFQCLVKMGREMLRRGVVVMPTTCKFWRFGNVQDSWLDAYWKWLWAMQIPKKLYYLDGRWYIMAFL